eukprot:9190995-Pyramimonas_sp.AAC.1
MWQLVIPGPGGGIGVVREIAATQEQQAPVRHWTLMMHIQGGVVILHDSHHSSNLRGVGPLCLYGPRLESRLVSPAHSQARPSSYMLILCSDHGLGRRHLTANVDATLNLTFELVYLDFTTTYDMVETKSIDMVYTDPSVYACLEREYIGTRPVASLLNRRTVGSDVYELSEFYGAFIVRSDSNITRIAGEHLKACLQEENTDLLAVPSRDPQDAVGSKLIFID